MQVTPSKNWREWREDRAKRMRFVVEESIDSAAETAVDFSAATAKCYLRAWKPPADSRVTADLVLDSLQTKVGDGSGGKFDTLVTVTADYGELHFALVAVDETVTAQPTPSTYQEEELVWWSGRVLPSVQPA